MEETRAFPSKVGKVHELVYITDSEYVREGCSLQCFDACEAFALDVQSLGGETRTERGSVQRRPEPRVYDSEACHGPRCHNAPVVAEGRVDWRRCLVREAEDLSSISSPGTVRWRDHE